MKDQEFEDEAALLLAEYGNKHGQVMAPPVPVDEMVEVYLGLSLEFLDMQKLFGVDDIHGALWVNEKRAGIDQWLDQQRILPCSDVTTLRWHMKPDTGGFTANYFYAVRTSTHCSLKAKNDRVHLPANDTEPIEYQANRFASCLLMPREILKRAWHEWRDGMDPIFLPDLRAENGTNGTDEMIMENAVRPLAGKFQVSPEAMRIRAEGISLLMRKREASLF